MKRFTTILSAALITVMLFGGCGNKGKSDESQVLENQAAEGSASLNTGEVVAVVNGREINESEVATEQNMLMQQMAGRVDPSQMQMLAAGMKKQAFDNIVKRVLLREAADKEAIGFTEAEKTAKIESVKGNFPSEEAFQNQMKISGLTTELFEKEIEYTIKIEKLIDKMTANVEKTTLKEARSFYDSNIDQFKTPERVKASHILVKVEGTDTEEIKAEKKKKIDDLLVRVKGGQDFADVASENSDCPSSKNGGDLGYFSRGQMVQPFEDTAFALEKGKISDVIETRFGYHIIKLMEKDPAGTTPFEDVGNEVVEYLYSMKKQMEVEKYLEALLDLAAIEYSDSTLMTP
ncbi:MAG: peptidylprolyl isomerase [Candidatus Krumholzibacteriota bacterium]|nr:peptidylprolyl isomerase [Candidatus Krumholzibacteriota bacterium]